MYSTATKIQNQHAAHADALIPSLGVFSNELDQDNLVPSGAYEEYIDKNEPQNWADKLGDTWKCLVADYSLEYKFLPERFSPLHNNQFAIDYELLKEVDEYKVVEITRCAYEIHNNQNIRVCVKAKFVFGEQEDSTITPSH